MARERRLFSEEFKREALKLVGQPGASKAAIARDRPNQKLAVDFTYVWTGEGWLFVAVDLDLYSRRVVGWSMQPTMTLSTCLEEQSFATSRNENALLAEGKCGTSDGFGNAVKAPENALDD